MDSEFDDQHYDFSHFPDQNYFFYETETETALDHNILQRIPSSGSYSSYPIMTSNTNFNTTGLTSLPGSSVEITTSPMDQRTNNWTSSNDFQYYYSSSSNNSTIPYLEANSTWLPANSQMLCGGPNDNGMENFNVEDYYENLQDFALNSTNQTVKPVSRSTSQDQPDHVIAERKRREKLNQRFVALSALIPGLGKLDKASVLGEAIKYVKQLQERVELLEQQTKRSVESVVLLKKSQLSPDNGSSLSDDASNGHSYLVLPVIEARASDNEVLIRVHCLKQNGVLVKILNEIEKLHLSIVNSSVLPFGTSLLDITVVSQMNDDFSMTMNDLVQNLRSALLKFMCPVSFSTH